MKFVSRSRPNIQLCHRKHGHSNQETLVVNHPTIDLIGPRQDITRAEVSAIIYQTLVLQSHIQPINSPYIV